MLDGVNIKTLDPIWYRRQIGFVSQEPVLFACSIKENIAYGGYYYNNKHQTTNIGQHKTKASSLRQQLIIFLLFIVDGVTQEQIENAAKQANAHEFIMTFSEKYDTVVGER